MLFETAAKLTKEYKNKKYRKGIRHSFIRIQHRYHQVSTFVYKADGQTFYTRSKIQCLLRGRKYPNSISEKHGGLFRTASYFAKLFESQTAVLECVVCFILNWDILSSAEMDTANQEGAES